MVNPNELEQVIEVLMEISRALSQGKPVALVLSTDVGGDARTILFGSISQCSYLVMSANASVYSMIESAKVTEMHVHKEVDPKAN